MRKLDLVAAGLLVLLGCVHNFVAAPMIFDEVSERALWFVTGGISLWLAGAINLVRQTDPAPSGALRAATIACNLVMLVFVVAFATVGENMRLPQSWLLVAIVAWLLFRSFGNRPSAARSRS